ncbi:hypothetical protein OG369_43390 [Streptomyces sp. NBC_01221]|uniref:hypothetical protein n=1 Tax=Streptomyces sp. NBC_01221 TaxID=2903782 RepID=UPI00225397C9|nr:hypothetical protein [Streptomyces sp. NBC_01221]MCX4792623.1 hypothetical protein [Streptomyces sp. NBC_01221]
MNGMVFAVACLIGYVVFERSKNGRSGQATTGAHGDLALAIASIAAAIVALAFLLGLPSAGSTPDEGSRPAPTSAPSSTTAP